MRTPEALLEVIEMRIEGRPDAHRVDPAWSIEATLILAHQVKRIADLLEESAIENDDGSHTLYAFIGMERIG